MLPVKIAGRRVKQVFTTCGKLEVFSLLREIEYYDTEGIVLLDGRQALTVLQITEIFKLSEWGVNVLETAKEMEWVQVSLEGNNHLVDAVIINNYNDYVQLCYFLWEKTYGGCPRIELRRVKQARARHKLKVEKQNLKIERQKQRLKQKEIHSEKIYQLKLQKSLGGSIEVPCLVGRIDLLTDTEIIEIKEARLWKSALGQLLVYSIYYPSHTMRMHLFGNIKEPFFSSAKSHCSNFNVVVTFEK